MKSKKLEFKHKFFIISTGIMVIFITFTTVLHHVFPDILNVPSTRGPYRTEFIIFELILTDSISILLATAVFYHSFKKVGLVRSTNFLYGSIIFTGLQECFWILTGRFNVFGVETYYFTNGGLWFLEIPLYTCLGWYILVWCCVDVAQIIFRNRKYVFHAFIAGIMATSLDFFIDPVMVNRGSTSIYSDSLGLWTWLLDESERFSIFSIPFGNFFGWFKVIFLFAIFYGFILNDKRVEERGIKKSTIIFFSLIPILLAVCVGLIIIFQVLDIFLRGVNLIPIGLV
jgi:hypothetical protein